MNERMIYDQFIPDWKKKNSESKPRRRRVSSFGMWAKASGWTISALGAALISGAHSVPAILHTIPAVVLSPARDWLSLAGFTIFELLIFLGALSREDNRYAKWALWISMTGALAANIGSSITATHESDGDILAYIVAILLAITAPLAAFLAGEMIHRLLSDYNAEKQEADAEYVQAMVEWQRKANAAFTKYDRQFQVSTVETDVNLRKFTTSSQPRPTPKMKLAVAWLQEHPEHWDTESRVLSELIGVSHTLANEARKYVKLMASGQQ